jgi:hypothetical protein
MNRLGHCTKYHILTGAAVIAFTLLFMCPNLWAANPGGGYEMSFVKTQAHGDLMTQGRYRLVIYLLAGKAHGEIAAHTNLCVARTMIGEYPKARRNCNRAVELTEQAAKAAPASQRDEYVKNRVVALSNRGVLRAIRNQQGAEEDFRQAMELRVYSDTATRNFARLNNQKHRELAAQ